MAIACLRLLTLPPFPPRPLLAVPRLYRCISLLTSLLALREYLRFFFVTINFSYLDLKNLRIFALTRRKGTGSHRADVIGPSELWKRHDL
jgi:hypothetical protein